MTATSQTHTSSTTPRSLSHSPQASVQFAALAIFAALSIAYTWPLVSAPGASLSGLNDPPLFTWILNWVSTTIYTNPASLWDGRVFYPYSHTITFSEPLLFPAAIVGAPVTALTGNPILAYNVTLLVFMTLSGWAAWYAVMRITGLFPGALIAGIVYALSSYKMGYYNFLNIHLSFALPLAVVSIINFVELQRWRDLLLTVLLVWLQATSIWYGTIPLILVLVLVTISVLLMRPVYLTRQLVLRSVVGSVLLAALVMPIALPYWQTSEEMGFVRGLADVNKFRADLLSFLDPGLFNAWHRVVDSGRAPGLYPGVIVYGLAMLLVITSFLTGVQRAVKRRAFMSVLIAFTLVFVVMALSSVLLPQSPWFDHPQATRAVTLLVLCLLVLPLCLMFYRGLPRQDRSGDGMTQVSPLGINEWVLMTGFLTLLGVLLTLGPVMHVNDTPVGAGIYSGLHRLFPGFSGLRIAIRLAFVFLFFVGVLAALMLLRLSHRHQRLGTVVGYVAVLCVVIELWPGRITYQNFDWSNPPAVYAHLQTLPDDRAIFELPTFDESLDSLYMLWAIKHGKPLVNGVSGFYPPTLQPLAASVQSIPARRDAEPLQAIDGLGYLAVHLNQIRRDDVRQAWKEFAHDPAPGMRLEGHFDDVLLFEVTPSNQPRWRWRAQVPAAKLNGATQLRIEVDRAVTVPPDVTTELHLTIDGKPLNGVDTTDSLAAVFDLPPATHEVAPYQIELQQRYRLNASTVGDARYQVGRGDDHAPVDLIIQSGAREYGSLATVWVNGVNYAPRQPGYNVVVLDGKSGALINRAVFDVIKRPEAISAMVQFLQKVSTGNFVVIALKDRGIAAVDATLLSGLELIGAGVLDPRSVGEGGSHLVVGVRGASRGAAVELADTELLEYVIGEDRRDLAFTVKDWRAIP